jgi:hypothetical protein
VKNIETKIGKDVIESLTLGMYEDARFIYREYIQNCADQLDEAVGLNLMSSLRDGRIEIEINPAMKTISIYDNATGIKSDQVQSVLKNIAQSTKDRNKHKGFRGIGRLGGLGYCEKLTFETSYSGEDVASFLVWDSGKLKAIINNREMREEASLVIDEVTNFYTEKCDADQHYFKVTLEGVSNDLLLDTKNIYQYLSMVAPVAFSKGFLFKSAIYEKAKNLNYVIDEYPIYVNTDQVFKLYTTSIYKEGSGNKERIDKISDIETYEIRDSKSSLLAWGWYSISKLEKIIPQINIARSIRLRKGNIQIGSEDAVAKLFKEPRGTRYFFGEIYAVSQDLIPNARRDYFLDNKELKVLEKRLKHKFGELQKLYYFSSKIRNQQKRIDDFNIFTDEYNEKSTNGGFSDHSEKNKYRDEFEKKKVRAENAKKDLDKTKLKVQNDSPVAHEKIFKKIVGANNQIKVEVVDNPKIKLITDEITRLSRKDRKLVSRIFAVIDNVLPKELSGILKEKINEELQ